MPEFVKWQTFAKYQRQIEQCQCQCRRTCWSCYSGLVLPKKDTTLVSMSRARQPVSQSVRPSVRQLLSQPGVYRIWLHYIYCCDLIDCCHEDGKETLARVAAAGLGAAAAAWLPRHTESAPRDAILNFAHLLLAHVFCCRI